MKKGLLIIISGPSGVGKSTIRRKVMDDTSLNLAYSVSMTTRTPRNREVDGVDYYFVTKEEFQSLIATDSLLEWAEFVGNCYGTPKSFVEILREEGKNVILEIEVEGAKQVLAKCQGNDVISIFLLPPSFDDLEKRIRRRKSDTPEAIHERLEKAKREIGLKHQYHYVVLNDDLNRASKEIIDLIRAKINSKIID